MTLEQALDLSIDLLQCLLFLLIVLRNVEELLVGLWRMLEAFPDLTHIILGIFQFWWLFGYCGCLSLLGNL